MEACFLDRTDAGRQLAEKLDRYAARDDVIVLGLARGGVPVAYEVASRLRVPLDVFTVRKLGVPGYPELAMGAIASGGIRVENENVVRQIPNAKLTLDIVAAEEITELERRERTYRDGRPGPGLIGRTIILVDDGLATGASMRAAVAALRRRGTGKIVVAVPVGAPETCLELEQEVDELICAMTPTSFCGVGQYYEDFSPTTDEEVHELLASATQPSGDPDAADRIAG